MKFKKSLLSLGLVACATLALASCGNNSSRNTVVPYGKLNASLNSNIATAGDLSLTVSEYYSKLRAQGYDVVKDEIKKQIYNAEYNAVKVMYETKDFNSVADKDALKKVFELKKDNTSLYTLDAEKYTEIRQKLLKEINNSIASTIYGVTTYEKFDALTQKDLNKKVSTFIDTQAKVGVTLTKNDIRIVEKNAATYQLNADSDAIEVAPETLAKLADLVDAQLLSQAAQFSSRNALYQIAEDKTVKNDDDEDVKNDNNIITDTAIKSSFNSSYATYGEYRAIIIQFDTLLEANTVINKVLNNNAISTDENTALDQYINIYDAYYAYKTGGASTIDSDDFKFVVNKNKNDFSDLPSSVSTLVKTTLEDGQYLVEPRNVDNKYVLCYKYSTKYDVHGDTEKDSVTYDKLTDAQKATYDALVKEDIVDASRSGYTSTNEKKLVKNSGIKIYDPLFEYKFKYDYTDNYTLIDTKATNDSSKLFEIGNYSYTVEQFYAKASKKLQSTIITDYFNLKYANQYYDYYVDNYYISSTLHKENEETLDKAISTFNSNGNSTYSSDLGVETYLLNAYGYPTKESVLTYYYDASKALETYKAKSVFTEWIKEENDKFSIDSSASESFLKNILEVGNAEYSKLFGINLDHILINIDDDNDGNPDDPKIFLAKHPEIKDDFEAAVTKLAKAIYLEAIHEDYKDNKLYKVLDYIVTQYEQNAELKSNPGHYWSEYKEFPFLLKAEQLASSGDITESSVSNFVEPFAEYVKNVYKFASSSDNDTHASSSYTDGVFYFVYPKDDDTLTGSTATKAEFADKITIDALCQTSFGYHMLVLNSYSIPRTPQYKESSDSTKYQANLKIILREYTDSNDATVTKYINTDAYNEDDKAANFKQLFIYYVQSRNGASSSLNSDVAKLLGRMFDNAISQYVSSNFQNYLLLNLTNPTVLDVEFANYKLDQASINAVKTNYKNLVLDYDSESKYASWFEEGKNWTRPDANVIKK